MTLFLFIAQYFFLGFLYRPQLLIYLCWSLLALLIFMVDLTYET